MYYNARYYDPALGTFVSPDSLVPDPGMVIDYNRFLYVRGNPLRYTDPNGQCPKPPESWGPSICIAMFIEPSEVKVGSFKGGGDGRGFSTDSDPSLSRAYVWISLDSDLHEMHANPTTYRIFGKWRPVGPSDANTVEVERVKGESGQVILVKLDLVLAGLPIWASPHINAKLRLYRNSGGDWMALWARDGYPWAEAYYHGGEGNVQVTLQDPAVRGEIYDLDVIEDDTNIIKRLHVNIMRSGKELGSPVRSSKPYVGGFGSVPASHVRSNLPTPMMI